MIWIWIGLLVIIIGFYVYSFIKQKRILNVLTQEEFIDGYRKAQLIDVREPDEFNRGHIRGARNIPLSQFKQSINSVRADKPVFIYCQNSGRSARAANALHKNNCKDLNVLKGGFKRWTGKIDSKK